VWKKARIRRYRPPGVDYEFIIKGYRIHLLSDFYHALLRHSWPVSFVVITVAFISLNALFALAYMALGGIHGAAPGSFADAYFFSLQSMSTIGYGAMYPESHSAHLLVLVESIVGLIQAALATGLVFAKFSRSTSRMEFAREVVVSPVDGIPTLMIRLGNERANSIVDVQVRLALSRTETTAEGHHFYRNYELSLIRDRLLSLSRSWTLFHRIDDHSPLYGQTPETLREQGVELFVMVVGIDDTTIQAVHAGHRYSHLQIRFGARYVDILSETADGNIILDLERFHDVEPTRPTDDFPYPTNASGSC